MAAKKSKSNKTAHVLNLLSGAPADTQEPDSSQEAENTAKDSAQNQKLSDSPVSKPEETPSIPIVNSLGNANDPLGGVILNSLEEELEKEAKASRINPEADAPEHPKFIPGFPAGFVPPEPASAPLADDLAKASSPPVSETPAPQAAQKTAPSVSSEHPASQTAVSAAPQTAGQASAAQPSAAPAGSGQIHSFAEAPAAAPQEGPSQTYPAADVSTETSHTVSVSTQSAPAAKAPAALPAYQYINVMEYLIQDRLDSAVDMFDMCPCDRCKVDAAALALSNLTPKYIVVNRDHSSPLLNYYSNRYSTDIMTQLTKACTVVKENPRH